MDAPAYEDPWLHLYREEIAALRQERNRLLAELAESRRILAGLTLGLLRTAGHE